MRVVWIRLTSPPRNRSLGILGICVVLLHPKVRAVIWQSSSEDLNERIRYYRISQLLGSLIKKCDVMAVLNRQFHWNGGHCIERNFKEHFSSPCQTWASVGFFPEGGKGGVRSTKPVFCTICDIELAYEDLYIKVNMIKKGICLSEIKLPSGSYNNEEL